MINWVEQPDDPPGGCGIACLAMLLGLNYVQMTIAAPMLCAKCGVAEGVMYDVLAEHGYMMQRVERMRASDEKNREQWPPKPWAAKHLVAVLQTAADSVGHWVVMDGRGNVFDPADAEYKKTKLSRYHSVESVTAVVPTGKRKGSMR